jgi:hypothetical protein
MQKHILRLAYLLLAACPVIVSGCASDSYAAKGAATGAGTGALAGAIGAAATALVFGGNVAEAAGRGAVYGGTSGAVVGGMSGARQDQRVAEQERAEYERRVAAFRKQIGDDAFNGFVALAECKDAVAIANAHEAQQSKTAKYALAGLWLEALVAADRADEASVNASLERIVTDDDDYDTVPEVRARLDETLAALGQARVDHGLERVCDRS